MKTLLTFFFLLLITNVNAQVGETIGAGVIDFLLTNPSTANKFNSTQSTALSVIGNVLNLSAQRKHDVNVAQAGRNQVVYQVDNGNRVNVYMDNQGNMYLLYNNVIYPISSSLVTQAKRNSENNTNYSLDQFDMKQLKQDISEIKSEVKYTFVNIGVSRRRTIPKICEEFNIPPEELYFVDYEESLQIEVSIMNKNSLIHKYLTNNKKVKGSFMDPKYTIIDGHKCLLYGKKTYFKYNIQTVFTCNWVKDMNNDGISLDEFKGVKRSFSENEQIQFVIGFTSPKELTYKIEVLDSRNGDLVYNDYGRYQKGSGYIFPKSIKNSIPPGIYIYNVTIIDENMKEISRSEKIEIIANKSKEKDD